MDNCTSRVALQLIVEKGDKKYSLEVPENASPPEIWLYNGDAEGMTISGVNLFDMLDAYFKKNF